eukprot:TRINITY_DN4068_c0_g1_i1.p1 TRINITY_DN4068_c0_g1~~TRINITY_DN4068_c0_g1_i1.p1  ORF type:complete len:580 (+),score=169.67 TRINITY_DN4068_c0_g1_i1:110-1741(+)
MYKELSSLVNQGQNECDASAVFKERLLQLNDIPHETFKMIMSELRTFERMPSTSSDYNTYKDYLDFVTSLPWGVFSADNYDIKHAREVLEDSHYGLKDIKDRILEFVAISALSKKAQGKVICFVGPPGVGKTSICESVAKAVGKKFQRIAVGSTADVADIRGHRRTYIGAMPGRIVQALRRSGTSNPAVLLDEIDKISDSGVLAALLDVLDPSQNHSFSDSYVEVPFDISKVLFLTTANYIERIPQPLKDRLEIINVAEYQFEEKFLICKKYVVPKALRESGLTSSHVELSDEALKRMIKCYGVEPGVRNLQRNVSKIFQKIARSVVEKQIDHILVTEEKLEEYLGQETVSNELLFVEKNSPPGHVIGLYASPYIGGCTTCEARAFKDGKGLLHVTGNCGKVKKETVQLAWDYAQEFLKEKGLDDYSGFFKDNSVHIHFPAGAKSKDGPSGGVTVVTSLLSLALNRPVSSKVAMTGAMSLSGMILPVGRISSKCSGAVRNGIQTVILPKSNERDWLEVPESIREQLSVHFVQHYSEVFEVMFP